MRFTHWLRSLRRMLGLTETASRGRRLGRLPRSKRFELERLEDRVVPAGSNFVASSFFDSAVYEFNSSSGALLQTLVAPNSQATLANPAGMVVGPDGNLYFSSQSLFSSNNASIVEYNVSTQTLSTFIPSSVLNSIAGHNGLATAFAPAGLRFGPDDNLYVSLNGGQGATSGGAVIRFNITSNSSDQLAYAGTFTPIATGLVQPTEMVFGVGSDSHSLYVSNSGDSLSAYATTPHDVIKIANADGASPSSSVFIPTNTSQLNYPSGLTWGPDGDLYVTDLGATSPFAGQVVRYHPDGTFDEVFSQPSTALQFQFPSDSLFDADGNLLTANLGLTYPPAFGGPGVSGSITEFNPDGTFNQVLTSSTFPADPGTGVTNISPSQLALLATPAVSLAPSSEPADTVGVAYNQTIAAFGGTGPITLAVTGITNPIAGLNIPANGTTGIAITGTPTAAGTETFTVTATDSLGGTATTTYSITVNPAITLSTTTQTVVASSFFDSAVYEFDGNSGALLQTLVAPNSQLVLSGPSGMAVGPDGNLYFASENNGAIVEFNFSSQSLSTFITASQLAAAGSASDPSGLAFGPDGNLYVSLNGGQQAFSGGAVVRFNINNSGGQLAYAGTFAAIDSNFVQPTELAFGVNSGDQGSLYVSDAGTDTVVKIANAIGVSPSNSTFVSAGSGSLNYSSGLTWGLDGKLYVTDLGATAPFLGQVLRFNADGSFDEVFTQPAGSLQFQFPSDALFLANGDLLTANLGLTYPVTFGGPGTSGSITEFNADGTFSEVLTGTAFPADPTTGVTNTSPSQLVLDTTAPSTLSTVVLAQDTVNVPYSQTITAGNGTGAIALTVNNISNPIPGLVIPASGTTGLAISGTPTAAGTETFTVTATDSLGATTTTNYSITVNPAVTLSPNALPGDALNTAYSQVISASGGTGTVTLTVSGIVNPLAGLNIPGSGVGSLAISGTPTVAGTETFLVTATDALGGTTGPVLYSVTVSPAETLTLSPVTLTPGAVASVYGPVTFSASGGFGAYAFRLAAGNKLPAGLTLSTAGILSGTPTIAGTFSFTIVATDSTQPSLTGQLKYSMLVTPALAVSPAVVPVATVGNAYSAQLRSTGGSGSGYVFTSSALPAGLSLSSAGLLSGIPADASGSPFHFVVTSTDSNHVSRNFNYVMTVDPAVTVTTNVLPVATVGDAYRAQLAVTGGAGRGYVFTSTALPSWLKLSSTGVLSGTPPATASATANFMVTVTDALRGSSSTNFTLTVDPALVLSPTTLTVVTVGNPFSTQLTTAGGSGSGFTYRGLNVPAWMTVSSTGLLSGTPTTAIGTPFHFGVVVTDNEGGTIGHTYALSVNPSPVILPVTLPVATVGNNFSVQLKGIGGSGMGYLFTSSSLPAWLTLSSNGLLSGMPPSTTGSPLGFAITLTDSNSVSRTFNYALTIDPAVTVATSTLPIATVGDAFRAQLTAAGGSGHGYVFTGVGLPAWLKVTSAGLLFGTPPASAGSSASFVIHVTDNLKGTGSANFTLSVDPALVLSPTTLTVVTVGNPFSTQLTAAGGSGAGYTFTGLNVPAWMTVSSTGLLTGTPTTAIGSPFHFGVIATDNEGGTIGHTYALSVNPAPTVLPATLPVATVGDNFSVQLRAVGGSGMGFVFSSANLPAWLTLSSTGLLNGMPPSTTGSPLSFTVTLTDSNGAVGSRTFALTVDPALTLNPGVLPIATVGSHFSTLLTATGGFGAGYTFRAAGLPAGLTLSPAGVLSGTPTIATSTPTLIGTPFTFTVTATDNRGGTTSSTYSLTVDSALAIQPTVLPPATAASAYNAQLSATGGSGFGYTFTAVGLPAGLHISSSGALSGTLATAINAPFHFTVIATDSNGGTTARAFALAVRPPIVFRPTSLPVAHVGRAFSLQLTATGGSGLGYSFVGLSLPSWLTLAVNGMLTGTPPSTAGSPLHITVEAIDSNGATGTHTYTLTVLA